MRYEAKTEEEAVAGAARALGKTPEELKYTVIRDEKSFWGGKVVEIEVEEGPVPAPRAAASPTFTQEEDDTLPSAPERSAPAPAERREPQVGATDA
ncbi:MAG TPA: Jag N-terminal domain-containing protein, partial [Thermoanaerobaculia bacterium]|nr:Jag N-terminal domain-containing protein [Thermoanaerobaculia bacterium]